MLSTKMQILAKNVIETNITQQEFHHACILKIYLSTFSPILGLYLFSSLWDCSWYFTVGKLLRQIYRWCIYFGSSMVWNLLLHGRKFYPKTRLDPTLWLQLNSLNELDCRIFDLIIVRIKQLVILLQLPEVIITSVHHDLVLVDEALCLLFQHLSYPNRFFDLQKQFGRHENSLCRKFYYIIHLILSQVRWNVHFYHPSATDFNVLADAFALQGVPDTIHFWSVIRKKHQICRLSRN